MRVIVGLSRVIVGLFLGITLQLISFQLAGVLLFYGKTWGDLCGKAVLVDPWVAVAVPAISIVTWVSVVQFYRLTKNPARFRSAVIVSIISGFALMAIYESGVRNEYEYALIESQD